jgi:hypothetical protein
LATVQAHLRAAAVPIDSWAAAAPFLADGSVAAFIGIDYQAAGVAKAKCYFRGQGHWCKAAVIDLLRALAPAPLLPTFADFHDWLAPAQICYPERALMVSIGAAATAPHPPLNLHFALPAFLAPTADVRGRISELLRGLGMDDRLYRHTLATITPVAKRHLLENHALVTLGLEAHAAKLNLYLKPTWQDLRNPNPNVLIDEPQHGSGA